MSQSGLKNIIRAIGGHDGPVHGLAKGYFWGCIGGPLADRAIKMQRGVPPIEWTRAGDGERR